MPSSPGVGDGAVEVETAVEVGAPSLLVGATTLLVVGGTTSLVVGATTSLVVGATTSLVVGATTSLVVGTTNSLVVGATTDGGIAEMHASGTSCRIIRQ